MPNTDMYPTKHSSICWSRTPSPNLIPTLGLNPICTVIALPQKMRSSCLRSLRSLKCRNTWPRRNTSNLRTHALSSANTTCTKRQSYKQERPVMLLHLSTGVVYASPPSGSNFLHRSRQLVTTHGFANLFISDISEIMLRLTSCTKGSFNDLRFAGSEVRS